MTKLKKLKAAARAAATAYTAARWRECDHSDGRVATDVAWNAYDDALDAWLSELKKRKPGVDIEDLVAELWVGDVVADAMIAERKKGAGDG